MSLKTPDMLLRLLTGRGGGVREGGGGGDYTFKQHRLAWVSSCFSCVLQEEGGGEKKRKHCLGNLFKAKQVLICFEPRYEPGLTVRKVKSSRNNPYLMRPDGYSVRGNVWF